jgi:hypothetical protein
MLLRDLHALAARKLPYIEEFLGAASDYQLLKIGRS